MSRSKKHSVNTRLNALKFILLTILMALIFYLVANVIWYTRSNSKETQTVESDFRGQVDLKKEIKEIFFTEEE